MLNRTEIRPGQPVPLALSAAEKSLLVEALLCLEDDLAKTISETPSNEPVPLSLDDLDGLADHIAAEANRTQDKRLKNRLDRIFKRIDTLLDSYVEVGGSTSLRIFDPQFSDGITVGVKLRAFVSINLFLADARSRVLTTDPFHHRSEENVRLNLTQEQRRLLGSLQPLPENLIAKLRWHADESEPIKVSIDELALLLLALAEKCREATSVQLSQYEEVAAVLASRLSLALDVGDAHSIQTRRTRKLKKRSRRPSKTSASGTVGVLLTASQRKIVGELSPELAGRLMLDERYQRTIQLTQEEITLLAKRVEAARPNAKNGMQKNSFRHIAEALSQGIEESEGNGSSRDDAP